MNCKMASYFPGKLLFKFSQRLFTINGILRDVRQMKSVSKLSNFMNFTRMNYLRRVVNGNIYENSYILLSNLSFLSLLKFIYGINDEEEPEFVTTMKRSILLKEKKEFEKAEKMLHLALRQAQTVQHEQAITYIYDLMANLAFDIGDLKKAETLFVSVMQRIISSGASQHDLRIVHMSLKLAKIYESRSDYQKAEDGYKFCINALEKNKNDEETTFFQMMTLDWYAHMLIEQSREREALIYLLEAYDLSKKINGKVHEQTVTILNNLGMISCRQGEHDKSIAYLTEAIDNGNKLEEFDLSPMHINLGFTFLKKGLHDEARKSCKKGQMLAKSQRNEDSLKEANVCLKEISGLIKT